MPFQYSLESAGEEGTINQKMKIGSQASNRARGKKGSMKQMGEMENESGNPRRSGRVKDKGYGNATESDF